MGRLGFECGDMDGHGATHNPQSCSRVFGNEASRTFNRLIWFVRHSRSPTDRPAVQWVTAAGDGDACKTQSLDLELVDPGSSDNRLDDACVVSFKHFTLKQSPLLAALGRLSTTDLCGVLRDQARWQPSALQDQAFRFSCTAPKNWGSPVVQALGVYWGKWLGLAW